MPSSMQPVAADAELAVSPISSAFAMSGSRTDAAKP
jgi:hypothetical protein